MMRPDSEEPRREILEQSPGRLSGSFALLERVPRWLWAVAAVALLAAGGAVLVTSHGKHPAASGSSLSMTHGVFVPSPCAAFVNQTENRVIGGERIVLGDVAVPAAYLGPMLPNGNGPWRYWMKTAFGVRGDSPPVTISVPEGWQDLAGIDQEANGMGRIFHIPSCPPRDVWNFTTGGIYLKAPTACLPLNIQVGRQTATVWFGLGRHCPHAR
jgi:hypothetical protein